MAGPKEINALAFGFETHAGKRMAAQAVAPAADVDPLIESALLARLSASEFPAMGFAEYTLSPPLSRAVAARCQELPYAFVAR
jgi:hypothetical protein